MGVIKIRSTRVRKYAKKKWGLFIISQVLAICYLFTILAGFLTSDTKAYFSDKEEMIGSIQVGIWDEKWDKSSLKFPNKDQNQAIISCNPNEISVAIKNDGANMTGSTQYEVYYADKGDPKNNGTKIFEGVISPMTANQIISLKYMADKPGSYQFRAIQRPGHNGSGDLWSETITVKCNK
jgi:YqxM protein